MAAITEDAIKELASFRSQGAPVVSCYLDVDGRRHTRPADVEQELEHLVREASGQPDARAAVEDLRRIEKHVRAGLDRTRTRGLAVFACTAEGLWRVVELPVPVQSRLVINATPAVAQLEAVAQESARVGVLVAGKQRAKVFVFELGELVVSREVVGEAARDIDTVGHRDQGDPSTHAEELVHQHLRNAAREAFEVFQDAGVRDVLLSAPDHLAGALENDLHPYLRERLRGRLKITMDCPFDDLRDAVMAMEHEVTLAREAQVVERLREALAHGRGTAGLDDTLVALADRRVEVLLVSNGFEESGWRCATCATLATVGRTCPRCGDEMDHAGDLVEEAIDAAYAQGCRVDVVEGSADLDVLGRIGALLRY